MADNSTFVPSTDISSTANLTEPMMFNFDDEWQRILVAMILLVASIAGIFGNSLVILSVLLSRKLRSPTNVFVVNLSVADLLTCLALPWNIVALLSFDGWPIANWICSVAAAVLYIPVYCSVCTLASIGLNRFIIITRPVQVYQKIFSTKVLCGWLVLLWLWPFVVTVIPPLVADFGALGYNERFHSCSSMSSNKFSDQYDLMTAILIYPFPLLTILVSYVGIFMHVRNKANKLNASASTVASMTEDSITLSPEHHKEALKMPPIYPKSPSPPISTDQAQVSLPPTNGDDQLSALPVSKAVARVMESETKEKTNSLPTKKSYKPANGGGVNRTCSYPVKISSRNETGVPLRKKRASSGLSISQRIRSTIRQATTLNRISRRQLAITKNMFYVVIAYLLCLSPFVFCLVIDTKISTILIPYAAALVFFNSCINPAIYATKHPYFKKIFSLLVKCKWYKIPEPSDTLRAIMMKGICTPK